VAKYIYFEEGKEPTPEDIVKSEILEGRIREGFVRIRQLLVSTVTFPSFSKMRITNTSSIGHDPS
jgi:hypothetical protein